VPARERVWDLPVRLVHWGLAALVAACWVLDDGGPLHRQLGYVAAGLVLARLTWAAVRRGHSGFAALRPSPRTTLDYLRAGAPRHVGHDPLGLWMVWLLWLLVLALAVTGWASRLDAFWGDERVTDLHALLADALLVSVVVHLAGVALMSWRWRENLPASMVTGTKATAEHGNSAESPRHT
jgi:cytochrome b